MSAQSDERSEEGWVKSRNCPKSTERQSIHKLESQLQPRPPEGPPLLRRRMPSPSALPGDLPLARGSGEPNSMKQIEIVWQTEGVAAIEAVPSPPPCTLRQRSLEEN